MNTAKIELILSHVEERMRYELQMLIREFLPFAEFEAEAYDVRIIVNHHDIRTALYKLVGHRLTKFAKSEHNI